MIVNVGFFSCLVVIFLKFLFQSFIQFKVGTLFMVSIKLNIFKRVFINAIFNIEQNNIYKQKQNNDYIIVIYGNNFNRK